MRRQTIALLAAALLFVSVPATAKMYRSPMSFSEEVADLEAVERRELSRLDNAALLAAAERREARRLGGGPTRFAEARTVGYNLTNSGTWETLGDGSRLWRLRIASPGARHLNLGFSRFDVPPEAGLWIYNPAGDYVEGPYTASHRTRGGQLWTPIVYGSEVVVELWVGAEMKDEPLDVRVGYVNHGFRAIGKSHGECNVDVICPEGDPYRDQIRSVAYYSIFGIDLCSGQLVNNTAEDERPFFLSAFHCGISDLAAQSLVFYWGVEAPVCGQQDGGTLDLNQSGSSLVASEARSDFLLLELNEPPDPEFDVFFSGWDVSGAVPPGAVGIHHPQNHVKSISFSDDPLLTIGIDPVTGFLEPEGDSHWEVDNWEQGTTEPGSSGSGLWDPDTKLLVGVLTGGFASCFVIDADFYGKLFGAWDGGGTSDTRLREHLDPLGLGVETLVGRYPKDAGCRPGPEVMCLQRRRFQLQATRTTKDGTNAAQVARVSSSESGVFTFFSPDNWELVAKVLDRCRQNGYWWVLAGGATSLDWSLKITDTSTKTETSPGTVKEYLITSADGRVVDGMAFPCEASD